MSLLAPWFLLGAALIAGPILFHLIRRATKDRIEFSAMQFLEESPPRVQKKARIQNPWLLILRCAIIALLAFAFARPFISDVMPLPTGMADPRHVAIVLDESASMRRDGHWSAAIDSVRSIARSLASEDNLTILALSDSAEPILGFERWRQTPLADRPDLLADLLGSRSPGWSMAELDTGIDAAVEAIDAWAIADTKVAQRDIYLVSDLAEGSRVSGLTGRLWSDDFVFHPVPIGATSPGNASLRWLGWSDTPGIGLQARLALRSTARFEPKPLTLTARDAQSGSTIGEPITLATRASENRLVLVPLPVGQLGAVSFELRGDNVDFDNQIHAVPPQPRELSVAYIGDATPADPQRAALYLSKAAESWTDPIARFESKTTYDGTPVDLAIVDAPLSREATTALRSAIESGAYAIILASATDRQEMLNTLTGVTGWRINPLEASDIRFGELDFQHPFLTLFADPRFSDFSRIRFWKAFGTIPPDNASARIVARFDNGAPAVVDVPVGEGRAIVWGSDWSPSASQWALSTKFVPWLQKVAQLRLGGPKRQSIAEIGDTDSLLRQPEERWTAFSDGDPLESTPAEPGLYRLIGDASQRLIALNTPSAESLTDPLPLDTWEQLGLPLEMVESPAEAAVMEQAMRDRLAHEVESEQQGWRWLILLAAVMLAAESLFAHRQTLREAAAR